LEKSLMALKRYFSGERNCLIKNVLVAVDGSENSAKALDFALDFAEKYAAKVTILNVFESPAMGVMPQSTGYFGDNMPVFANELTKFHEEILAKALTRAKEVKPNLEISTALRDGDPAVEIVAMAKDEGFDVVVVAHRGVGRVRGVLLGSVSEKVARLASCPVVIVR
jgi:nucleotide-binding universal stress UspA family protein